MTKVYRVVPAFPATVIKHKTINKKLSNIEGEFYDLNYISFEKGYAFFKQSGDNNTNVFSLKSDERCKFFFLFPFDALWGGFRSIEKASFSHYEWELLEYDIPDEILLRYCGYGFYSEKARIEFRIPESIFASHQSRIVDKNELNVKLYESYKKFVGQFKYDPNKYMSDFNAAVEVALGADRNYYYSQFITNNRSFISRDDLYLFDDNNEIVDILKNVELIKLLQHNGIKCTDDTLDIYNDLEKDSNDVYRNSKRSLYELEESLKDVLPTLSKINKN